MAGLLEKTYSNALFQLCIEENSLENTNEEIIFISECFRKNSNFIKVLSLPTVTVEEKTDILTKVFKDRLSELTFNFLNVLVEKGRIEYFEKIADNFRNLYNEHNNILEITATTTQPLSDALKKKLIDKLENISSKKVILVEKIDEKILGGIVLSYGNTQLDSSIKSRLDKMRSQINSIIA